MHTRILFVFLLSALLACKHKTTESTEADETEEVQTPVTVTTIEHATLTDSIQLNATSSFLQSNIIKASTNGYIRSVNIQMGQRVSAGQVAFTLQTKEAQALGNTINKLDPSFHFSGMVSVRASASGAVQELNHHSGDYVQEGDQLAVLADEKSFGFILNLPYELRAYVTAGKAIDVELPDGRRLAGSVASFLPNVDSVSQTQAVLIRVNTPRPIPQNLIAKVRIVKEQHSGPSLPKQAVLSNEAQTDYWVMKLIDSVTAVKVPVIKGMETKDRVEIVRPVFTDADKIVLVGNYGLPDTAKVRVVKSLE
jgi:multidrug efflux pump subunit AcrA (membrane-fusion protein)